ncbi:VTT domain-containing protein [Rhizobium sp. 3T7]|uniref:VTT domain-containing protein n=1 Tax=Rhizobium sp. 3T7 TaxID=2874922 RepID=UPI001CC97761|nr:VTT domain-containing protein [Rhizobium sp. 3T7]MBZ9791641.1 VTT domain-containing protein [Rhizobium sp. 3T7]
MDPIGTLIPWIATYGVVALVGATFLERLIPFLPSYVLLVMIGMGAAEGYFYLPAALALATAGSVLGCLLVYAAGTAMGENRSRNLLERLARLVGVSSARFLRWLERFRANEHSFALGAQMIPTIRLISPGISGLLRTNFWPFLGATTLGAGLWNATFIGAGYAAASGADDMNASLLAIKTLVALVVVEGALVIVWRVGVIRRVARKKNNKEKAPENRQSGDLLPFFRAWLTDPLRIAAVSPSSNSLAELITSEITIDSSPVIELGAGTGAFTRALIKRGVPEDGLILVESDIEFSRLLGRRFPGAQILSMDAARLGHIEMNLLCPAGAAVSGLPLLSMPPKEVIAILEAIFDRLHPHGAFYQFTYSLRCPIARPILDRLGLKAVRIGGTLVNLPPASVYRITRRAPRVTRSAKR